MKLTRKLLAGVGAAWLAGAVVGLAGQVASLRWEPNWGAPLPLRNVNGKQQTATFPVKGGQWMAYAVQAMWDGQVPIEARRIKVDLMVPAGALDSVQVANSNLKGLPSYAGQALAECAPSPTATKCYFRVTVLPAAWWGAHPNVPRPAVVLLSDLAYAPAGMAFIPGETFQMGDAQGDRWRDARPVHAVQVDPIFMAKTEVTGAQWFPVEAWAFAHGYDLGDQYYDEDYEEEYVAPRENDNRHPMVALNWCHAVKWCNARSEMEGLEPVYYLDAEWTQVYRTGLVDLPNAWVKWNANGYRLPTEAEWEHAARGGAAGLRFPWGNTISHSQANYFSLWRGGAGMDDFDDHVRWDLPNLEGVYMGSAPYFAYDVSPTSTFHPAAYDPGGSFPLTLIPGRFAPNGYGLFDMAGNVDEWCWDVYDDEYYANSPGSNPRGPDPVPNDGYLDHRVYRGGHFWGYADQCCVANRIDRSGNASIHLGFRPVRAVP